MYISSNTKIFHLHFSMVLFIPFNNERSNEIYCQYHEKCKRKIENRLKTHRVMLISIISVKTLCTYYNGIWFYIESSVWISLHFFHYILCFMFLQDNWYLWRCTKDVIPSIEGVTLLNLDQLHFGGIGLKRESCKGVA